MKMKPEHYNYLKAAIKPILARNVTPETERGRWSALHSAVPVSWICSDLYPYLDDSHIDTALRAIFEELKP
jgi:hypothetical protein